MDMNVVGITLVGLAVLLIGGVGVWAVFSHGRSAGVGGRTSALPPLARPGPKMLPDEQQRIWQSGQILNPPIPNIDLYPPLTDYLTSSPPATSPLQFIQEQTQELEAAGYTYELALLPDDDSVSVTINFKVGGITFNQHGEIVHAPECTGTAYLIYMDVDPESNGPVVMAEVNTSSAGASRQLDTSIMHTTGRSMLFIMKEVERLAQFVPSS